MTYYFKEHTSDIKVIVTGRTLSKLFRDSANALKDSLVGKVKVKNFLSKKLTLSGDNIENLLYKFLEELLFLVDSKSFLFSKIKKIELDPISINLNVEILGDDSINYNFRNHVKAITYSQMKVERIKEGFKTAIVFDV